MAENVEVRRGQVWYIKFNDAIGYEEAVGRPAVVISTNEGIPVQKTLTVIYMTTTPKTGGLSVELFTPKKKCWAMCNQIATIDRSRFLQKMCDLSETEMLRIDCALRKALALPVKNEEMVEKLDDAEKKVVTFEVERDTYKKLYEKALEELVAIKLNTDFVSKAAAIEVPKPVIVAPEPEPEKLDLSELKKVANVRTTTKRKTATGEKVNINTATAEEIAEKTGLGSGTSLAIVQYRRAHGKYKHIDELKNVGRFGPRSFKKYSPMMEV